MDKFTVDLDQVLNDFEYSELTDHYNSTKVQGESHSSIPSSTQNITKHSINNVFHSLNEYLNTNINVKNLEVFDSSASGNLDDHFKLNSDKECKTDQNLDNIGGEAHQLYINQFEHNNNEETSVTVVAQDVEETDSSEDQFIGIEAGVDENVILENHNNHLAETDGSLNKPSVQNLSNDFEENHKTNVEINHSNGSKPTENTNFNEDDKDDVEVNQFKETSEELACNIKQLSNEIEDLEISPVKQKQEKSLLTELYEADNNIDKVFILDRIDGPEQEVNDNVAKLAVSPVGFEDDVELDDQEISKLLSELEQDDDLNFDKQVHDNSSDSGCKEDLQVPLDDLESEDSNNVDISDNNSENEIKEDHIISTSVTNVENNTDFEAYIVSTIKEESLEKSTVSDNKVPLLSDESNLVTISTEAENPQSDTFIEYIEVPNSEVVSDQCSEKCDTEPLTEPNSTIVEKPISLNKVPKSVCDSTAVIAMEESEENQCENENEDRVNMPRSEETSAPEIQKEISQESLPRPQNLVLPNGSEANRKIDLIGDPGSTPYNNIYINNEIHKQEHNSGDMDCSSSSPTFSDASSTASTASTEDIQDKNDVTNLDDTRTKSEEPISSKSASEYLDDISGADNSTNGLQSSGTLGSSEPTPDNVENIAQSELPSVSVEQEPLVVSVAIPEESTGSSERLWLGKEAPLWIPDSEAMSCLHCDMKFTVLKRRHHCRACGLVLCSKCCHLRFKLEYLDAEARVCNKCHDILNRESSSCSSSDLSPESGNSPNHRPNPNNPAEYCSTVSPLQQVGSSQQVPPPAVMVPVGVLKRKGSNKAKSNKSVMFCDGIRPGSDLTNLDNDFNYNNTVTKKLEKNNILAGKINKNLPIIDSETNTFIPKSENSLPPTVIVNKSDIKYAECSNNINTVNTLKDQELTFAIHISLHVNVKIIDMSCCMNKVAWCFSTEGLINVGQDEIVYLVEFTENESVVPKDIFYHITNIYNEAVKGNAIKELGLSLHNSANFLDSKNHAGFVYIRPTFQCLENIVKPKDTYLVGILIHRWETPWAKLFPLRLVLRLGAEYRYYPSPIISTRHRDSVYVEIGHTIINILADFRNFSYTLPQIRGLTVHMEDKNTTVSIPVNRYDQVIKSLNNSSDHILAFAGNFSLQADSHLVCIQDTQGNENCYSTHAINIHNKPRKITGASFIVFNGALKSSSGLTAKSNIIEDGLMIQVLPEHLEQIRESLRAMKSHMIPCGCVDNVSDETVQIIWSENDTNFNVGIVSTIDNMSLSGIPSIRVHNGKNYICHNGSRIIRWTEVFIIQNGEDNHKNQDPIDISRVSESIAKATCDALVKYIDLLIANNFQKIGIRTTLHVDNVSYCAGSNGTKLPPIYMKSLDNELIPVLHRITSSNLGENAVILELIFRILNV